MTPQDDPLRDLTDAQREAVLHGRGPMLVVAGPGSGKTRVITRRVANLIAGGVPPSAIIAITFTNKAAQEMARRVNELCHARGAWLKTFHSACAGILRRWPEPAGLTSGFSIFDSQDQRKVLRAVIKAQNLDGASLKPAQVRARISRWKTGGVRPDEALDDAAGFLEQAVARMYAAYERALAESNAVDFDDLLVRALRVLTEDEPVRRRLQQRFEYVLIDEYQDTSPVQFKLAALLAEPERNLCATGDPDQSIYAFRNADVRNILEFERNYPGALVVRLEQNFRSVGNVLRAADALIANNRDRHPKRLVTDKEDGKPVRIVAAEDEHGEGLAIADAILAAYARGTAYRDIAVFYRVNAQSRAIETALRSRGIPYTVVKGVEFYQRAEVKDLLAYLKIVANPRDRESLDRALTTPRRGVGAKSIARLHALATEHGWTARESLVRGADTGEFTKRAAQGLRATAKLLDTLERGPSASVAEIVRDACLLLRYEEYLRQAYPEDWQDRVENIRELVGAAEEFDERSGDTATLPGFLTEVGLVSDADGYDPDAPRVTLMTLHSAKGLEFREVLISGVEEGLLPHARSEDDRKAIEEERRLLFVGITRAKEGLMLSYARWRRARLAGGLAGGPSSFLAELPVEALDTDPAELFAPAREPQGFESRGGSPSGAGGGWRRQGAHRPRPGAGAPTYAEGVDAPVEYSGVDADPSAELRVGLAVHHPSFGRGEIRRLMGRGARARAVVFFRGAGEKTLALSHAHLTPLDS